MKTSLFLSIALCSLFCNSAAFSMKNSELQPSSAKPRFSVQEIKDDRIPQYYESLDSSDISLLCKLVLFNALLAKVDAPPVITLGVAAASFYVTHFIFKRQEARHQIIGNVYNSNDGFYSKKNLLNDYSSKNEQ